MVRYHQAEPFFGSKEIRNIGIGEILTGVNNGVQTGGDYAWIGENVWIDNLVKVTIGNNAVLSQGAMLLCGNHNYKKPTFDLMVGEIHIEDGAWVGAQCTVCPGVTMHSHSVLTVGSIATRDCEAYCIYQGNPAKKVKERVMEG